MPLNDWSTKVRTFFFIKSLVTRHVTRRVTDRELIHSDLNLFLLFS